jgi:hypothetical protein
MESELSSKKKPQQDSCCMQLQPAFQKYILIVGFHKLPRIWKKKGGALQSEISVLLKQA